LGCWSWRRSKDTPGVFQAGQADLPGVGRIPQGGQEGDPVGGDRVSFREDQPLPKIGRRRDTLDQPLSQNEAKSSRERLTLIQLFEELRGRGYDGGYDAVRRYARRWAEERGQAREIEVASEKHSVRDIGHSSCWGAGWRRSLFNRPER
jgi:hypothetical protein